MIRYERCYFNVRVKAEMSQLNLQHGHKVIASEAATLAILDTYPQQDGKLAV